MKKFLCLMITSVLCLATFSGCNSNSSTSQTQSAAPGLASQSQKSESTPTQADSNVETRVLQLAHVDSSTPDNSYQILCETFKKNLYELSGGRFDVEIFGDSVLGGERDLMEGMNFGTIDMAIVSNMYFSNFVPDFMVFDMPYLFMNYDDVDKIFSNDEIMDPITKQLYDNCGVKFLAFGCNGFRHVINNLRPITKVEDYKGMKIRLPETPVFIQAFQAFGANPTTTAWSEAFTAVQQKTVDGLEVTAASIYTGRFYEICSYMSLTKHIFNPLAINMSSQLWDSLTEEEQGWFEEAAQTASSYQIQQVSKNEIRMIEEMQKAGCEVNDIEDLSPFREASLPARQYVVDQIGSETVNKILAKLEG